MNRKEDNDFDTNLIDYIETSLLLVGFQFYFRAPTVVSLKHIGFVWVTSFWVGGGSSWEAKAQLPSFSNGEHPKGFGVSGFGAFVCVQLKVFSPLPCAHGALLLLPFFPWSPFDACTADIQTDGCWVPSWRQNIPFHGRCHCKHHKLVWCKNF